MMPTCHYTNDKSSEDCVRVGLRLQIVYREAQGIVRNRGVNPVSTEVDLLELCTVHKD